MFKQRTRRNQCTRNLFLAITFLCASTAQGQYQHYQYLFPIMSKMYAAEGQLALSNAYLDSAIIVKDSLAREFNAFQMMRAAQKAEQEQYHASVKEIPYR